MCGCGCATVVKYGGGGGGGLLWCYNLQQAALTTGCDACDRRVLLFEECGSRYRELKEKVRQECKKDPSFYDIAVENSALKMEVEDAREAWDQTVGDVREAWGACLLPLSHGHRCPLTPLHCHAAPPVSCRPRPQSSA